ncbi:hypothetical protein JTB14_014419 [Gonioctena quinquepunctata]|nr:hypothetical protein JTB14_014418 [Gonioctena quinquepunctata]KAG5891975.1 hypothetical protein JTB14_014419 [Gonioctena quinquepunctata]
MFNCGYQKEQITTEKDCGFEIKEEPTEIEPFVKFKVNDDMCFEQHRDEPSCLFINSKLKYDAGDSDVVEQKKPIINQFNNELTIKDEDDFSEKVEIKTEFEFVQINEDIKTEIGGKEQKENNIEIESKDHIFADIKKNVQEIISRSSKIGKLDEKKMKQS